MIAPFVGNFSGGLGSWAACKLVAREHGPGAIRLVFADVIVEDDDLYRFLLEGAADVLGVPAPVGLVARTRSLPWIGDETIEARKAALAEIRAAAEEHFGGRFAWLADGRTPREVFRDERFLGNSMVDPCSKILKRQLLDAWALANVDRSARFVCGIGDWERARFEGKFETVKGERVFRPGLRDRKAAQDWTFVAPLIDRVPPLGPKDLVRMALDAGVEVPECYHQGFAHFNCGGVCVKGGQKHWALVLKHRPRHFAYGEQKEQQLRETLGNVSMLTDRRGDGKKKPLPLVEFRRRLTGGDAPDWDGVTGACNCMVPPDPTDRSKPDDVRGDVPD